MDNRFMVVMSLMFYTWMFRVMQLTYRDAAGLWTKDWAKPMVSMAAKLVFSVVMVRLIGDVIGVIIPTILILTFIYFPWEAQVLYKHLFHRKWTVYLKKTAKYTLLNLLAAVLCYFICAYIAPASTAKSFFVRIPVIGLIFPSVWLLSTCKSAEFRHMCGILKRFLKK